MKRIISTILSLVAAFSFAAVVTAADLPASHHEGAPAAQMQNHEGARGLHKKHHKHHRHFKHHRKHLRESR